MCLTLFVQNASDQVLPRDDHCMSVIGDGKFLVFGGFVNGSRVNEVASFEMINSQTLSSKCLVANEESAVAPLARASLSGVCYNEKLYVFGGQDDDNNKMGDMWEFDTVNNSWSKIEATEGDMQPTARSGHSSVVHGDKMYIFGGILELTKELNDMLVFDLRLKRFI